MSEWLAHIHVLLARCRVDGISLPTRHVVDKALERKQPIDLVTEWGKETSGVTKVRERGEKERQRKTDIDRKT